MGVDNSGLSLIANILIGILNCCYGTSMLVIIYNVLTFVILKVYKMMIWIYERLLPSCLLSEIRSFTKFVVCSFTILANNYLSNVK